MRLLRNSPGWCQGKAEARGLALQVAEFAFAELLGILFGADLLVLYLVL